MHVWASPFGINGCKAAWQRKSICTFEGCVAFDVLVGRDERQRLGVGGGWRGVERRESRGKGGRLQNANCKLQNAKWGRGGGRGMCAPVAMHFGGVSRMQREPLTRQDAASTNASTELSKSDRSRLSGQAATLRGGESAGAFFCPLEASLGNRGASIGMQTSIYGRRAAIKRRFWPRLSSFSACSSCSAEEKKAASPFTFPSLCLRQ